MKHLHQKEYQTISFIMNSSDKVPQLTPVHINMPKISGTSLHKLLYPEVFVLHFHKQWKNNGKTQS
jgi:hypothetical protein